MGNAKTEQNQQEDTSSQTNPAVQKSLSLEGKSMQCALIAWTVVLAVLFLGSIYFAYSIITAKNIPVVTSMVINLVADNNAELKSPATQQLAFYEMAEKALAQSQAKMEESSQGIRDHHLLILSVMTTLLTLILGIFTITSRLQTTNHQEILKDAETKFEKQRNKFEKEIQKKKKESDEHLKKAHKQTERYKTMYDEHLLAFEDQKIEREQEKKETDEHFGELFASTGKLLLDFAINIEQSNENTAQKFAQNKNQNESEMTSPIGLGTIDLKNTLKTAKVFLEKALEYIPDNDVAMVNLGYVLCTQKDFHGALKHWEKFAETENVTAQFCLSLLYYERAKSEQDFNKAFEWCEKAAEKKLPEAQYNLGLMYYNGKGTEENLTQAKHWLTQAAKQGYVKAQQKLQEYSKNFESVKNNPLKKEDTPKNSTTSSEKSSNDNPEDS